MAAAVAAATSGFAIALHMPKEAMFFSGTWCLMVAAGWWASQPESAQDRTLASVPWI
jgi:hypothetical protein